MSPSLINHHHDFQYHHDMILKVVECDSGLPTMDYSIYRCLRYFWFWHLLMFVRTFRFWYFGYFLRYWHFGFLLKYWHFGHLLRFWHFGYLLRYFVMCYMYYVYVHNSHSIFLRREYLINSLQGNFQILILLLHLEQYSRSINCE